MSREREVQDWQVSGYSFEDNHPIWRKKDIKKADREHAIEHYIRCSKRLTIMLCQWVFNMLLIGGIGLVATLMVKTIIYLINF